MSVRELAYKESEWSSNLLCRFCRYLLDNLLCYVMFSTLVLVACEPQILEVQVTRVIKTEIEVERVIEKIVEVEVEVTREVQIEVQKIVEVERDAGRVVVLGAFVDADAENFGLAVKPFEEHTGIEVIYDGSRTFEQLLTVREASGDAPDVAVFPSLGIMTDFARDGKLVKLETMINTDLLRNSYGGTWLDLGSIDKDVYGIWYRASVSSLVWYPIPEFEMSGYEIPATWDELMALSKRMVADGRTPWCLGMESGAATGWPGADWIEDIMLRTAGPQVFDQWVRHEIPFDHPDVRRAFEIFGQIGLNPDYVHSGAEGILNTSFDAAIPLMLADPPGCYLHRQAGFLSGLFPEGVEVDKHVGTFLLPGIDEEFGVPMLVTGDIFAAFKDTPQVRALMAYLATTEPHFIWAGQGGYISPHAGVGIEIYGDEIAAAQAELLLNAHTIRFDASDMMPREVGAGSFLMGMQKFIAGEDLDEVLNTIEASWPDNDHATLNP